MSKQRIFAGRGLPSDTSCRRTRWHRRCVLWSLHQEFGLRPSSPLLGNRLTRKERVCLKCRKKRADIKPERATSERGALRLVSDRDHARRPTAVPGAWDPKRNDPCFECSRQVFRHFCASVCDPQRSSDLQPSKESIFAGVRVFTG